MTIKTKFTLEIEITHDGTSSNKEMLKAFREFIERESEPDDFGVIDVKIIGSIAEDISREL